MHPVAWDAHVQHKTSDSSGFPLSLVLLVKYIVEENLISQQLW